MIDSRIPEKELNGIVDFLVEKYPQEFEDEEGVVDQNLIERAKKKMQLQADPRYHRLTIDLYNLYTEYGLDYYDQFE